MKTTNRIIICSAIAVGMCTPVFAAHAPDTSSSRSSQPSTSSRSASSLGGIERASQILKGSIYDSNNKKIGAIEDVVVDLESGRVLYVVVDSGDDKVAVSPGAFTSSRGRNLRLNADAVRNLKDAPQFTRDVDHPETISKADFVDKVYKHFGESAWWQGSAPTSAGSFNNVHKVSDLIGMNVQNVSNEPMGEVHNLALDMAAGRIAYVILTPDRDLNLGRALYALPPDALTLSADHKTLSSNIDKEKLASAPHFTSDQWNRLSDPGFANQVYQYYGKQAYFSTPGALQPTGREDSGSRFEDNEPSRDRLDDRDTSERGGWDRSGSVNRSRRATDRSR
jgi:sporulation protein YlmC with PRC-barrel domain